MLVGIVVSVLRTNVLFLKDQMRISKNLRRLLTVVVSSHCVLYTQY